MDKGDYILTILLVVAALTHATDASVAGFLVALLLVGYMLAYVHWRHSLSGQR